MLKVSSERFPNLDAPKSSQISNIHRRHGLKIPKALAINILPSFCAFFCHSRTSLEVMLTRKYFWPQVVRKVPRENVFDRLIEFDWTATKKFANSIKMFMIDGVLRDRGEDKQATLNILRLLTSCRSQRLFRGGLRQIHWFAFNYRRCSRLLTRWSHKSHSQVKFFHSFDAIIQFHVGPLRIM